MLKVGQASLNNSVTGVDIPKSLGQNSCYFLLHVLIYIDFLIRTYLFLYFDDLHRELLKRMWRNSIFG